MAAVTSVASAPPKTRKRHTFVPIFLPELIVSCQQGNANQYMTHPAGEGTG